MSTGSRSVSARIPASAAAFAFDGDVGLRGGIFADEQDAQRRGGSGPRDLDGGLARARPDRRGERGAVEQVGVLGRRGHVATIQRAGRSDSQGSTAPGLRGRPACSEHGGEQREGTSGQRPSRSGVPRASRTGGRRRRQRDGAFLPVLLGAPGPQEDERGARRTRSRRAPRPTTPPVTSSSSGTDGAWSTRPGSSRGCTRRNASRNVPSPEPKIGNCRQAATDVFQTSPVLAPAVSGPVAEAPGPRGEEQSEEKQSGRRAGHSPRDVLPTASRTPGREGRALRRSRSTRPRAARIEARPAASASHRMTRPAIGREPELESVRGVGAVGAALRIREDLGPDHAEGHAEGDSDAHRDRRRDRPGPGLRTRPGPDREGRPAGRAAGRRKSGPPSQRPVGGRGTAAGRPPRGKGRGRKAIPAGPKPFPTERSIFAGSGARRDPKSLRIWAVSW